MKIKTTVAEELWDEFKQHMPMTWLLMENIHDPCNGTYDVTIGVPDSEVPLGSPDFHRFKILCIKSMSGEVSMRIVP